VRFAIAGSPEFHRLHWEALKDPALPRAFALETTMVRQKLRPQTMRATVRSAPTVRILVVVARPRGRTDVGYRTISRPLVESLRQATIRAEIDILPLGSYRALVQHLEAIRQLHGEGHYHVVHFDLHGALLTYPDIQHAITSNRYTYQARYAREDFRPFESQRAFLFFESDEGQASDPVAADEISRQLLTHQIPIVILNACQSGKQIGAQETSLGAQLLQAGVQVVLAMGYSITVTAARYLMTTLYQELLAGHDLADAIRRARLELANRKGRQVYFNQLIDLEDWLLPVVYQNQSIQLRPRNFTTEEATAYYGRAADIAAFPTLTYGFFGRDLDILAIEWHVFAQDLDGRRLGRPLLIRGMGGAGKTTLIRHLAAWWQQTQKIARVFSFGYDARAWNRQQILHEIGRQILAPAEFAGVFLPLPPPAQQSLIAQRLRANHYLLILDNLESVTGSPLAIPHSLLEAEQTAIREMLAAMSGGKTIILLGSRSDEPWLQQPSHHWQNGYPDIVSRIQPCVATQAVRLHRAGCRFAS